MFNVEHLEKVKSREKKLKSCMQLVFQPTLKHFKHF